MYTLGNVHQEWKKEGRDEGKRLRALAMALLIGSLFLLHVTFILLFLRRQWTCGNSLYRVYTVVGCPLIIMQYASHALASMLILLEARLRKTEYEFATSRRNRRPIIDLTMATFSSRWESCLWSCVWMIVSWIAVTFWIGRIIENRERIDCTDMSNYVTLLSIFWKTCYGDTFSSFKKKDDLFRLFEFQSSQLGESVNSLSRKEKIKRVKNILSLS